MGIGFQTKSKSKKMYVLTERLLSFNWQRFTLHKYEKRNLDIEFYKLIELPSYIWYISEIIFCQFLVVLNLLIFWTQI